MRTKPCLSLTDVKKILEACEAEALKNRWNVAVAIDRRRRSSARLPAHGRLADLRGSGDRQGQNLCADQASEQILRGSGEGPAGGVLIQGALPIMHQNECVGAIGVSGVQSHEDEQVALAGLNALG